MRAVTEVRGPLVERGRRRRLGLDTGVEALDGRAVRGALPERERHHRAHRGQAVRVVTVGRLLVEHQRARPRLAARELREAGGRHDVDERPAVAVAPRHARLLVARRGERERQRGVAVLQDRLRLRGALVDGHREGAVEPGRVEPVPVHVDDTVDEVGRDRQHFGGTPRRGSDRAAERHGRAAEQRDEHDQREPAPEPSFSGVARDHTDFLAVTPGISAVHRAPPGKPVRTSRREHSLANTRAARGRRQPRTCPPLFRCRSPGGNAPDRASGSNVG